MIRYGMDIAKNAINPGRVPTITADQLLYANSVAVARMLW